MKQVKFLITLDLNDEVDEQVYEEVLNDINNLDPNGGDVLEVKVERVS